MVDGSFFFEFATKVMDVNEIFTRVAVRQHSSV